MLDKVNVSTFSLLMFLRIQLGPLTAKPSGDLLFIKLWAALNKHQKWKKHVENIKMAKFESPGINE